MNTFVAPTDSTAIVNSESGVMGPPNDLIAMPAPPSDGGGIFGDLDGYQDISTREDFYPPVSDSPDITGPNVVTFGGNSYAVTESNYTAIARMYIDYQKQKYGSHQYDNEVYVIALIDAMRQKAGLDPNSYDVNDDGTASPNPDIINSTNSLLNNPIVIASNAVADNLSDIGKGAANVVTETSNFFGGLGKIFAVPGNVIIIAAAGVALFIYLKKGR